MAWCDVVEPCTLRECRIALGQSQAAFALMLGASPESYRMWDAGRRATPPKMLARARALATHRDDHARMVTFSDIARRKRDGSTYFRKNLLAMLSSVETHAEAIQDFAIQPGHVTVQTGDCRNMGTVWRHEQQR